MHVCVKLGLSVYKEGKSYEKVYLEFEPSLKVRVWLLTVSAVPAGEFRENWYSPVWSTKKTPVYLTAKL
jgi:hypothetical protein